MEKNAQKEERKKCAREREKHIERERNTTVILRFEREHMCEIINNLIEAHNT